MIRAAAFAALIISLVTGPLLAQSEGEAAEAARAAAVRLEQATRQLDEAQSARDRVRALTETVAAFEDGLEAMRDGLRRASLREARLTRELQAREAEVAQLLGVLLSMGDRPSPTMLLHPAGPVGTARSGMILTDVTPALSARADELRTRLSEITTLRILQQNAVETLQNGLNGVQEARTALSQAVADRTDLPRRFTEDPVRTAILIASTETLEGFASGLSEMTTDEDRADLPDISNLRGTLPLPVQGQILRRAGEADSAGITRPGLLVATRPRALVTAPTAATIRYRGPLLDYGNVMILEPQAGTLFVLAGLDVVYGGIGEVIPAGSPIGLMGGQDAEIGEILANSGNGTGTGRPETLYIEVRQDDAPVDPEAWFATREED
ncbi:peptidoglycan DD-metalloendopeptidase family protein [Seohaeicola sp. SP36]|uniref:murein hydrolase activator EnvC family protein n=1 Tax=unclassified Seohaeicola TaxID=2641111 RepID=UPI00237BD5C8|nr:MULTISPECIES: peptidoglycan DD-metalloendopeptidase family protein [unclassified Seohaeicola]MDD9706547.1 peptidoglycan DD-metalloendopeptidase family protein [Seohaeicola sp. 4SK31]MDD9734253.1 peptidoglycan DD-metalloendopeptidase family protein [Seohaeicola sp. SP36]